MTKCSALVVLTMTNRRFSGNYSIPQPQTRLGIAYALRMISSPDWEPNNHKTCPHHPCSECGPALTAELPSDLAKAVKNFDQT
jgi:hypothetical protein